jgi:hypothetical protein
MTIESPALPTKRQPLAENVRQHWIVDVARGAHLTNSELLNLQACLPTEEAFKAALRRAGS